MLQYPNIWLKLAYYQAIVASKIFGLLLIICYYYIVTAKIFITELVQCEWECTLYMPLKVSIPISSRNQPICIISSNMTYICFVYNISYTFVKFAIKHYEKIFKIQ